MGRTGNEAKCIAVVKLSSSLLNADYVAIMIKESIAVEKNRVPSYNQQKYALVFFHI